MSMIVRCDRCGGNVDVARLRSREGEVTLAGVFNLEITPIEARVCTVCGYMELYATRPEEISGPDVTAQSVLSSYDE